MSDLLKSVGRWLDARLQVGATIAEVSEHPVPRSAASWWYIFGSATLVVFILQVVTGICLATVYTPAADRAWDSLIYLNYQQPLGWYLRALHGWGSNFMVALMFVHMIQVFLFGAYKFPRELTWVAGCFLLLCTLGMAFTGQVLRFDQNAYWGLGIGASIAGRTPIIGFKIVDLILGGPIIAGETLSRFFALHVFVIPALLIGFVGLHLFLVLRLGINEWPMPGRIVTRNSYLQQYQDLVKADGEPFMPFAAQKDLVFAGLIILSLLVVAAIEGPIGPNGQPDPTIIQTVPRPDFFLPVAVLAVRTFAAVDRDLPDADRARRRHRTAVRPALPFGHRREELASAALLGRDHCSHRNAHRHAHLARHLLAVVAGDGRVERCADADRLRQSAALRSSCKAHCSCRASSAATATRSAASAGCAGRRSTTQRRGSRAIRSCAR